MPTTRTIAEALLVAELNTIIQWGDMARERWNRGTCYPSLFAAAMHWTVALAISIEATGRGGAWVLATR